MAPPKNTSDDLHQLFVLLGAIKSQGDFNAQTLSEVKGTVNALASKVGDVETRFGTLETNQRSMHEEAKRRLTKLEEDREKDRADFQKFKDSLTITAINEAETKGANKANWKMMAAIGVGVLAAVGELVRLVVEHWH